MSKCLICEKRPRQDGKAYCHNCLAKIEADKRRKEATKPVKYLTYKGHVVALYRNGGGKLKGELLRIDPKRLPKAKTLDLNTYLEGFSREQVKRLKASVLKLAAVKV